MKYKGKEKRLAPSLTDKAAIREIIEDNEWEFTRAELKKIIHREFFEDENPLDMELIDAAIARLLLLEGIEINADILQREREKMIHDVLKEVFKTKE